MLIRWINIRFDATRANWSALKHIQFLIVRFLLIGEFFFALFTGHLNIWVAQFCLVLWYNLFLIVSSHDFEESESAADLKPGQDWGVF
jgi:Ca2+/Na+ antiporter